MNFVLNSASMDNFINNNVSGIRVPQELIDDLKASASSEGKEKTLDIGLNIAARHIRQLKEENICDSAHVMAIGMEAKVPVIIEKAGLL